MTPLNFHIVIPAHNEEDFISKTLQSLVEQALLPKQIVVVDDHSTDQTFSIAKEFAKHHAFIQVVKNESSEDHSPGNKIVKAFYKGFEYIDKDYDIICKYDADLIFPENYLETLQEMFRDNKALGMAGGLIEIQKEKNWIHEPIADKTHIRGALKAYRKACFEDIGGIRPSIGWDTVDALLTQYHGWEAKTNSSLPVKHFKPTGAKYTKQGYHKQGEAMYKMRYGFFITLIASLKMTFNKKQLYVLGHYLNGYLKAKSSNLGYIVSKEEGEFIRKFRWAAMKKKLFN